MNDKCVPWTVNQKKSRQYEITRANQWVSFFEWHSGAGISISKWAIWLHLVLSRCCTDNRRHLLGALLDLKWNPGSLGCAPWRHSRQQNLVIVTFCVFGFFCLPWCVLGSSVFSHVSAFSVPLDGWNSAPLYWLTKQWAAHLLVRWQTFELYCSCLWALMSNAGTNTPVWASAQVPALGSWRCIITVALCEGPWLAGLSSNS